MLQHPLSFFFLVSEEQAELWAKHQEVIELVNQQMAEKHAVNIEINELHNLKKQEEEEIVMEKNAIEELKIIMAHEATEFREKKDTMDAQVYFQELHYIIYHQQPLPKYSISRMSSKMFRVDFAGISCLQEKIW